MSTQFNRRDFLKTVGLGTAAPSAYPRAPIRQLLP